jgi:hypothetical protein
MTEILTESFCERCGTRYTFESARPRVRLTGVKVLSRGLKNFVLSDDTSMDEAMAAARSEAEREVTAQQLDAFHKTFNFCMTCRQYTCPNCWNEVEARCLTCAPLALVEPAVALDELQALGEAAVLEEPAAANGLPEHVHELPPALAAEALESEAVAEAAVPLVAEAEADAARVEAAAVAEGAPPIADSPSGKAKSQVGGFLRRFRPGQSLDAELEAFERERVEPAEPAAPPEAPAEAPVAAEAASAEPVTAAAGAEIEAGPEAAPAPEPEAEPLAAATAADVVEQPTWRITAPDTTGATLPPASPPGIGAPSPTTADQPQGEPQWPARPQWPSSPQPSAGLPFLGRPASPQGGIDALWAASNQELATAPPVPGRPAASGIQPCVSCGLSLSATARFCRRCGTVQSR